MRKKMPNQKGFTLIEIAATLVIISTMATVIITKTHRLQTAAEHRAIASAATSLTTREMQQWCIAKLDGKPFNDLEIFNAIDKTLGSEYQWNVPPTQDGGTLTFGNSSFFITRQHSDETKWARWNI